MFDLVLTREEAEILGLGGERTGDIVFALKPGYTSSTALVTTTVREVTRTTTLTDVRTTTMVEQRTTTVFSTLTLTSPVRVTESRLDVRTAGLVAIAMLLVGLVIIQANLIRGKRLKALSTQLHLSRPVWEGGPMVPPGPWPPGPETVMP